MQLNGSKCGRKENRVSAELVVSSYIKDLSTVADEDAINVCIPRCHEHEPLCHD